MNGIKIYLEDILEIFFSYEEVEQIIEKRLREEVYDRLVQEILCRFDKRK